MVFYVNGYMLVKNWSKKTIIFWKKLQFLCQSIFSIIAFLALFKFSMHNSYLAYDSNAVINTGYINALLAKLAAVLLYWLGGAAYVLLFGLALYNILKVFNLSWKLRLDRLIGISLIAFSVNILCQIYQVGNYGNLPGGGRFGVWVLQLITWPSLLIGESNFIWLAVANSLLVAGIVLYTRLCFMPVVSYFIVASSWLFSPVLDRVNKIFNKNGTQDLNNCLNSELQQSVLEYEYQELLSEVDTQVYQDLFWQNYFGLSGMVRQAHHDTLLSP